MSYSSNLDLLYEKAQLLYRYHDGQQRDRLFFLAGFRAGMDPENSKPVGGWKGDSDMLRQPEVLAALREIVEDCTWPHQVRPLEGLLARIGGVK